jgi:hypothetical protein
MKIEIYDIDCSKIELSRNCVSFDSTPKTQKLLSTHHYSLTGIIIITLNSGKTNTYKYGFSSIGDDGTIDVVSEDFTLDKTIIKSIIVDYAVSVINKLRLVECA